MAHFKFYQDKKVEIWVRDFYKVEAETLDEAVDLIKDANKPLEDIEVENFGVVEFYERDMDFTMASFGEVDSQSVERYQIFSCDYDAIGECDPIVVN